MPLIKFKQITPQIDIEPISDKTIIESCFLSGNKIAGQRMYELVQTNKKLEELNKVSRLQVKELQKSIEIYEQLTNKLNKIIKLNQLIKTVE